MIDAVLRAIKAVNRVTLIGLGILLWVGDDRLVRHHPALIWYLTRWHR